MSPVTEQTNALLVDRMNGMFTPLEITAEQFTKAYDTSEIGPHIEKDYKGLSYLSWPFAYRYLKEHFPTLFVAFEEKTLGEVVFGCPGAYYLRPYLTDGSRRTVALVFPIMDRKHNAIKELDGRAISDNCQRAAVKAIATFTGLGLRLYAGEDIPKEEASSNAKKQARNGAAFKEIVEEVKAASSDAFDGKQALVDFCNANPLSFVDKKACQLAVKESLENIGLNTGANVKSKGDFGNAITTLVATWTKSKGIKITKADMAKEIEAIRSKCDESPAAAVQAVKAFYEAKK